MDIARVLQLREVQARRRRARRLAQFRLHNARLRVLRDDSNPFEIPEERFRAKYRLSREMAQLLVEEVRPHMRAPQRVTGVPIHLKVLSALHFFGHGSDQKGVASDNEIPASQPTVSRVIAEVVRALNSPAVLRDNIVFPQTPASRRICIQRNFERSHFPGVVGYVDGAHVLIVAPNIHEEQYVNRHQTHSLNVQVTCDSQMLVLNVLARHPGATQDSFIWRHSAVRARMEEIYRGGEQCWMIADSGYPHEPWLHVPIDNPPAGTPEANFNRALMIDRSVVERTIGHIRNRFRCLSKHRVLEYGPEKSGMIVNACVVLHNKCLRANLPPPPESEDENESDEEDPPIPPVENGRARDRLLNEARLVRQRLVARIPPQPERQPYNPNRRHRRRVNH